MRLLAFRPRLASIGAQALHVDRVGRKEQLAAEKALHRGFPKLPPSRRLDGTMCYYCQKRFPSRMALFAHLRRLIEKEREPKRSIHNSF